MSIAFTRELATRVADTHISDVPSEAIPVARDLVVDAVACMLAGSIDRGTHIVREFVKFSGTGTATVVGTTINASPAMAALANGTAAAILSYEDTNWHTLGHPGGSLVPRCWLLPKTSGRPVRSSWRPISLGHEAMGQTRGSHGERHVRERMAHHRRTWRLRRHGGLFATARPRCRQNCFGLRNCRIECKWITLSARYHDARPACRWRRAAWTDGGLAGRARLRRTARYLRTRLRCGGGIRSRRIVRLCIGSGPLGSTLGSARSLGRRGNQVNSGGHNGFLRGGVCHDLGRAALHRSGAGHRHRVANDTPRVGDCNI